MSGYNSALSYAMSYRNTIKYQMTEQEANDMIENEGLEAVHIATVRGYTRVKEPQYARYEGRFGKGVVKFEQCSSRLSYIRYYL